MSGNRQPLRPEPDGCGLAGADAVDAADLIRAAWGGVIDLAGTLPLAAPSRLDGWTVRDVLVHLGSWEEHQPFVHLIDDARHNRVHEVDDVDARNDLLTAAHHDAPAAEIVAALAAARDTALDFLDSGDAGTVGRAQSESRLGTLPVTTILLSDCFELAVHALDIAEPGEVPPGLLDAGLAALVDLAGALSARRGLTITVAVVTPDSCWATGAADGAWVTVPLQPGTLARELGWPAIEGCAGDVLDAAAGRRLGAQLVLTRRLRMFDLPGLLRLTAALEAVPGLPGGSALQAAVRTLRQTGRMVGRLGLTIRRSRG